MRIFAIIFIFFATVLSSNVANAISVIRDTEIESYLKEWSAPVMTSAGLSSDQVNLILVDSDDINAFVAGGSNIFIYTGLIDAAEYPEELIGVIGHELGHITGGHLIASKRAIERASYQSILATVLGIGAAVASGDSRAAGAISAGGSGLAASGYLSHSRVQESAADQAGLKYLNNSNVNPAGIVSFLQKLEGQELLPASQQSEYMRTHPLTRDRVDAMNIAAKASSAYRSLGKSPYQEEFDLVKAKLMAFRNPQNVTRYYNINDGGLDDLYAHAIYNYQRKNFDAAVKIFDQLIAKNPKNPYFYEMKAQTLRDAGRFDESIANYNKALQLMDEPAPLVMVNLAHVMIEQAKDIPQAETMLIESLNMSHGSDGRAYRLLATIYGRQGREADAQYYLAEESVLAGREKDAKRFVHSALAQNDLSASLKIKANDLKLYLDRLPDKDK